MNDGRTGDPFDGDPLDAKLRRRFGGGASSDADPDVVLDAMRPQLQRARTRRRAAIASAVGGIAAIMVVLVLVLAGGSGSDSSVRTPPASQGPVTTGPPTPTTAPTTPTGPADTVPETVPTTTNGAPSSPADQETSYSSDGGSIVVTFAGGEVSLSSSSPAAGYTAEVHDNGPARVEVRFSNGQTEWRIRVDVVDGQLVPEVTQH
jgi:hypothetical protein